MESEKVNENDEKLLITWVSIEEQKRKAQEILQTQVIPKEKIFQERKTAGKLSEDLINALKKNT